jgi:hypothetical protein
MRAALKIVLVVAACAATLVYVPAALGQELHSEATGVGCSEVSLSGHVASGGCVLHASGEVMLQGHVFGIESTASDCVMEVGGRVGGDGKGWLTSIVHSSHAGLTDCTRTACKEAGGGTIAWPITISEPTAGNHQLSLQFCVLNGTTQQTCTVALPIAEGANHDYEIGPFHVSASAGTNVTGCEWEGQLHLEGTSLELGPPPPPGGVFREATGTGCSEVSLSGHVASGGCVLHASGEVLLQGHVFGIETTASDCVMEVGGRVDGDGKGWLTSITHSDHPGLNDCTRTACKEAGGGTIAWPIAISESSPGVHQIALTFCVTPDGGGSNQTCTVALPISEGVDHDYEIGPFHIRASAQTNAPGCEWEGQLHLEGTSLELGPPLPPGPVFSEATGVGCSEVSLSGHVASGGCVLHASGEVMLQGHVFGIESTASDCVMEVGGRVGGDGKGWLTSIVHSSHAGLTDCTRTACKEAGGGTIAWPITISEPTAGNHQLSLQFCVLNGTTQQTCTVALPIAEGANHDYEIGPFHVSASAGTNVTGCEWEGQLHLEGTSLELGEFPPA